MICIEQDILVGHFGYHCYGADHFDAGTFQQLGISMPAIRVTDDI